MKNEKEKMEEPPSFLSIPSKIFLIGEYAVMGKGSAWVAAVEPRFRYALSSTVSTFAAGSPAARFAEKQGLVNGTYFDPWNGDGGFGGSTAEFAFAAYQFGIRDPLLAHAEYLKLHVENPTSEAGPLPSGADLLAQWHGGVIEWNAETKTLSDLTDAISELPLLAFSASHLSGRKTKTHEHLDRLGSIEEKMDSLLPIIELARSALSAQDYSMLGTAFSFYAERLAEYGWETEAAHADRIAFSELPEVLGAKGCGAMQTDAMIVLLPNFSDEDAVEEVIRFGEARGLRLLSRGFSRVNGIMEHA